MVIPTIPSDLGPPTRVKIVRAYVHPSDPSKSGSNMRLVPLSGDGIETVGKLLIGDIVTVYPVLVKGGLYNYRKVIKNGVTGWVAAHVIEYEDAPVTPAPPPPVVVVPGSPSDENEFPDFPDVEIMLANVDANTRKAFATVLRYQGRIFNQVADLVDPPV